MIFKRSIMRFTMKRIGRIKNWLEKSKSLRIMLKKGKRLTLTKGMKSSSMKKKS